MRRFLNNPTENLYPNTYSFNRPGSLTLRSNFCMQYDPRVLTDEWHEFQLTRPVDYDIKKPGNYNLHRSTYRNIWFGKESDPLPKSVTHEMMEEAFDWYRQRKDKMLPLVRAENVDRTIFRQNNLLEKYPALKEILHLAEKKPIPTSTYKADYKFPLHLRKPTKPIPSQIPDFPWMKYRPYLSHFTDTDCACHPSIHIWRDEGCWYPHGRQRPEMPQTDPEDPRLNKH